MSEDKVNKDNNDADDAATLKEKLDKVENEKVALEMKLRESDDDLYSDEYLAFLQDRKTKGVQQGSSAFGGRMADYTEEQLQEMGNTNLPQLIKIVAGEVYTQIKNENDNEKIKTERDEQREMVAKARIEIKEFAIKRPDFREVAPIIKDLGNKHKKLNLKQLYKLAGGKYLDGVKKEDKDKDKEEKGKVKLIPDTKPEGEVGMKGSDKNLSIREIIRQEYDKL